MGRYRYSISQLNTIKKMSEVRREYVVIPRSLRFEEFYQNPLERGVFLELLMRSVQDTRETGKGTFVEAGQCVMGYQKLGDMFGISMPRMKKVIMSLVEQDLISVKSVKMVGTIVTINDYIEKFTDLVPVEDLSSNDLPF